MDLMDYRRKIIANSPHLASASGAVASFSDGTDLPLKSLNVDIEPEQDLHGYDYPWVGGGGKNLIDSRLSVVQAVNTNGTWNNNVYTLNGLTFTVADDGHITINGTSTANTYFTVYRNSEGITLPTGSYVLHKSGSADIIVAAPKNGSYWTSATTNDSVVSLTESARVSYYVQIQNGKTISNYKLYPMFEAGTTASEWSPYENICPITGWNGVKVTRTGKNLFSFGNISVKNIYRANVQQMGTDPNAFYLAGASGTSDNMQLLVNAWGYVCTWINYQTTAETTITVSCKVKNYSADCNGHMRIRYSDTQNRAGSTSAAITNFNDVGQYQITVTATIPSGKYVGLEFTPASKGSSFTLTQFTEITEFQLEIGSTATPYEPYNGVTVTINLGQAVYGATLNPLTGVLTADRYWWELNTDASKWNKSTSYPGGFYTGGANYTLNGHQVKPNTPFICSHAKTANTISEYEKGTCFMDNSINIRIMPDTATKQDWIDYLTAQKNAGTPVQICCYLRNPVTIQLTPQQVRSLYGQNNIWADTGNVALEYWAHP